MLYPLSRTCEGILYWYSIQLIAFPKCSCWFLLSSCIHSQSVFAFQLWFDKIKLWINAWLQSSSSKKWLPSLTNECSSNVNVGWCFVYINGQDKNEVVKTDAVRATHLSMTWATPLLNHMSLQIPKGYPLRYLPFTTERLQTWHTVGLIGMNVFSVT